MRINNELMLNLDFVFFPRLIDILKLHEHNAKT
jgi:hypothetical protein